MLQYEQEQTQFAIRIERGRNLPPKDLSSQTSDPYVLVSTIPDWNNEGTKRSSTVNGNAHVQLQRSNDQTLIVRRWQGSVNSLRLLYVLFNSGVSCFRYCNGLGLHLLKSACRKYRLLNKLSLSPVLTYQVFDSVVAKYVNANFFLLWQKSKRP